MTQHTFNLGTTALHAGQVPDPTTGSRVVPLYQTSSYVFRNTEHAANLFGLRELGNIYTRLMNPTTDVFEKRVAAIEGGKSAIATASGAAAITYAILNLTSPGDVIVSADNLYGGTYEFFHYTLPKLGREVIFVDSGSPEAFRKAITSNTKAVYAETIGNPKLDIPDFEAIAKIAHDAQIPFIVDNTTGVGLVRPILHGADIVVLSATKYIGGHGNSIGGVIVDSGNFAWNNGKFPEFTEADPSYHGLKYWDAFGNFPGLGNVAFTFKIRISLMRDTGMPLRLPGTSKSTRRLPGSIIPAFPGTRATRWHRSTCTAGSARSSRSGSKAARRRAGRSSTTHQQLTAEEQKKTGVTPDAVRLSIGTEDIGDILADLKQALEATP